jgi:hypothetical protein
MINGIETEWQEPYLTPIKHFNFFLHTIKITGCLICTVVINKVVIKKKF